MRLFSPRIGGGAANMTQIGTKRTRGVRALTLLGLALGAACAPAPQAFAQSTSPLRCWVERGQFLLDADARAIACQALYDVVEIQSIVVNAGQCAEAPVWLRRKKLPNPARSIIGDRYREGEEFRFFVLDEKGAPGGLPKACQVRTYTIKANDAEWVWKPR